MMQHSTPQSIARLSHAWLFGIFAACSFRTVDADLLPFRGHEYRPHELPTLAPIELPSIQPPSRNISDAPVSQCEDDADCKQHQKCKLFAAGVNACAEDSPEVEDGATA